MAYRGEYNKQYNKCDDSCYYCRHGVLYSDSGTSLLNSSPSTTDYRDTATSVWSTMDQLRAYRDYMYQIRQKEEGLGTLRSEYYYSCRYYCPCCEFCNWKQNNNRSLTTPTQPRVLRNNRGGKTSKGDKKLMATDIVRIISDSNEVNFQSKNKATKEFEDRVEFIKTALDFSDLGMDRVKVSELPSLMTKAQREITVGKLRKLIAPPDSKKQGIIKTLWVDLRIKMGW